MRPSSRTLSTAIAGMLLAAPQAQAANVEFQNFFFDVCLTPAGALAARCAETPGATGNVSGDSESSLNPSQNLSHNQSSVSLAQTRSKAARERGEKLRDGDAEESGAQVEVGPFSLLVNVHGTWFERHADPAVAAERGLEGDSQAVEVGLDYRVSDRAVIGAIAGQCLGGGLEVALAGSQIFAAPDAQFGQPEMKLGVFAPAASVLLPYRVNQPFAEDLLFSGRSVGADVDFALAPAASVRAPAILQNRRIRSPPGRRSG